MHACRKIKRMISFLVSKKDWNIDRSIDPSASKNDSYVYVYS